MENIVNITPVEKTTTIYITYFEIRQVIINLYQSASVLVNLYSNTNQFVETHPMLMEGDDYANWGNNDDYIKNYVANKLGFTIANQNIEPQQPATEGKQQN